MTILHRGLVLVVAGTVALVAGVGWAWRDALDWATHPWMLNSFSPMHVFRSAIDGQPYSYPELQLGIAPVLAAVGAGALVVGLLYLAIQWHRHPQA